ncbi:7380_t:CDS:2 [Cetraspora pellucida]|uniref:7380_t:CDS:1 n=1 Tax=Cetraspora pellucida TaxID=1433469 RepID=A0ACA9KJ34_9GLOM|nr:7380_t:CDS:2 [Cetraspora pellucida]
MVSPIITFKKIKLLLFLVIFVIIPLVDSACSCCGEKGHNIRTCAFKNKDCPQKINGKKNKHNSLDISQNNCFFKIKADKFNTKGTKISPSCHCAREGDEQCHGIAKMLGGPGDCENCFLCSRKMNIDMTKMERLVKKVMAVLILFLVIIICMPTPSYKNSIQKKVVLRQRLYCTPSTLAASSTIETDMVAISV